MLVTLQSIIHDIETTIWDRIEEFRYHKLESSRCAESALCSLSYALFRKSSKCIRSLYRMAKEAQDHEPQKQDLKFHIFCERNNSVFKFDINQHWEYWRRGEEQRILQFMFHETPFITFFIPITSITLQS